MRGLASVGLIAASLAYHVVAFIPQANRMPLCRDVTMKLVSNKELK